MERAEASTRQALSEVPEVVTHHRAPEASRNHSDEVHAAGGRECPCGQQDWTSWEGEGHGVDYGGDQHASIRVFGEPAKDAIHLAAYRRRAAGVVGPGALPA